MDTEETYSEVALVLEKLKTPSLQWVQPPYGEHDFARAAVSMGLKIPSAAYTWYWKDRVEPPPYIEAQRVESNQNSDMLAEFSDIQFTYHPQNEYAYVETDEADIVPCAAQGVGGYITVACKTEWNRWYVWTDGQKATLIDSDRLETFMPAGEHNFLFRYLPWDVPLGLALLVVGIFLCLWLWRKERVIPPAF